MNHRPGTPGKRNFSKGKRFPTFRRNIVPSPSRIYRGPRRTQTLTDEGRVFDTLEIITNWWGLYPWRKRFSTTQPCKPVESQDLQLNIIVPASLWLALRGRVRGTDGISPDFNATMHLTVHARKGRQKYRDKPVIGTWQLTKPLYNGHCHSYSAFSFQSRSISLYLRSVPTQPIQLPYDESDDTTVHRNTG